MRWTLEPRLSATLSLFFLCVLAACGESPRDAATPAVATRDETRAQQGNPQQPSYEREAAALDAAIDGAVQLIAKWSARFDGKPCVGLLNPGSAPR